MEGDASFISSACLMKLSGDGMVISGDIVPDFKIH